MRKQRGKSNMSKDKDFKQSLAIALGVQKASKRKKMSEGGEVEESPYDVPKSSIIEDADEILKESYESRKKKAEEVFSDNKLFDGGDVKAKEDAIGGARAVHQAAPIETPSEKAERLESEKNSMGSKTRESVNKAFQFKALGGMIEAHKSLADRAMDLMYAEPEQEAVDVESSEPSFFDERNEEVGEEAEEYRERRSLADRAMRKRR